MRMVAVRYQTGLGVDVNNEKSVEWLQRSADQGNFEAQSSLGFAYLMGIGVSKDYEQALALFLGSAGVAQSRFYISNFYTHGWVGAKDKIKAYMWCLLATEMDSENTQYAEELAKLKSGLTATRLAQATKAAAEQKQLWAERKLQFQGPTISYLNKKNARLPFRLESGMIIVPLQVSGLGEVNFLVDTGSPGSVLAQRVAKKIKLKSNDYAAAGGIGPKISLARLAHDITLSTPELAFKKVSLFLFPDFDIDEIVGLPIGGVLGMDIMRHAVVAINYKEKIITLTSPDSFQLEPGFTKIPLRVAWNKPYIETQIINNQVRATEHLMIDTGFNASVSLSKRFQDINPELKFKSLGADGRIGIGGVRTNQITRSQGIQIGPLTLNGAGVRLEQHAQDSYSGGLIGAEILSRFDVVMDSTHQALYLKPNTDFSLPFPAITLDGYLLKSLRYDYKTRVIHTVIPGSPADKAGIKPNDVIVKVNGQATSKMTNSEISENLTLHQTYHLVIKRGTELIDIKLEPIVIR
jgi:hypothetical protein